MDFKQKLLLIDGHALFHRAYHALPAMTGPDGFPTGAIFGFLSMLFKALADIKPSHALVTFDVPGPTFRDKIAADYKATRKAPDTEMVKQLPKLKEILNALNIPIYEKAGFEADDLLGIIAHKTPKNVLSIIVSGDLDLLQLIDNHTQVYRFKTGFSDIQIFDTNKMVETYGLHPSQWVDYKAIRGDTSDNIPGVPGIGEKGAMDLIQKFGSLDEVYEAVVKKDKRIKPGTLKKLEEGKTKAYLSQKLSFINQKNHLDFDFGKCAQGDYDQKKTLELLRALGIKALDSRLPKTTQQKNTEDSGIYPGDEKIKHQKTLTIESKEEAVLATYLLDPGKREYKIGSREKWGALAQELQEKNLTKIFLEIERPLMSILASMENCGVKLDLDYLKLLSTKLETRIDKLSKQIHKEAGEEFNIASPTQLREILFEKLNIPTENLRKTDKTKALSTAAGELEKLRGLHPIIDLISEYRELTKLKSTYVDALPELVSKTDHRLHTSYNQTITATGRLSSSEPNLQNIPIRTELGNQVRKAFITDKGYVLASLDYSQIELRIAAHLSQDPEMMKIYKSGGDFHAATAAKIFEVKESDVTPSQRRDAKTINFSVLYGVSGFGLSERTEMTRAEALDYIKKYYQVFRKLKTYLDHIIQKAHADGFTKNLLGRIRYYPEINSPSYAVRAGAERAAMNMPFQSLAADIMKMAMIKVDDFLKKSSTTKLLSPVEERVVLSAERSYNPDCRMILTVHDELVFEIKPEKINQFVLEIKKIMESVYKLSIPTIVDAKIGSNWMEMKEYE